jgi:GNAT superfamily N-acetyltransferase
MKEDILIKDIPEIQYREAVDIFSEAFYDDELFVFAFPEPAQRNRLTEIMYEFVVYVMVPMLNLKLKGAYVKDKLAGCVIYTTPDADNWGEQMMDSIQKMREKANDERINLIGEFARLGGYEPEGIYYYGNELAVKKEYRGRGIGKALVYSIIDDCRNSDECRGILIDTANPDNIEMYKRWGFELKETKDFYKIKKYFMWKQNK